MKKYFAVFLRKFEVEIEADDIKAAQVKAETVVTQFPPETCKLHSITAEDYVAPPEDPVKPYKDPGPKPKGGGTPGTPTIAALIITDATRRAA